VVWPQTGKAEYIMYRKYSGEITSQESYQLLNINVPGYAHDQKGYTCRTEYDTYIGKHWAYYLIIESARGKAGQGYDVDVEATRGLGLPPPAVSISSNAEYEKLPHGTIFRWRDGNLYRKP
jgi:hypothetical protein